MGVSVWQLFSYKGNVTEGYEKWYGKCDICDVISGHGYLLCKINLVLTWVMKIYFLVWDSCITKYLSGRQDIEKSVDVPMNGCRAAVNYDRWDRFGFQ